ncbi:MAG: ABC transporter permease [Cyclobacteriaceae bacterium]|nr:ABC transporter permease [Cyclobacteriaceae bacterium]
MNDPSKKLPPRWANKFLEWYCRPDLLEEIQGDVDELFERTSQENPRKAKRQFVWNVIRFFRLKNIRRSKSTYSNNLLSMLKSYLLIGFRNVMRNGATSFINIFGLAVGVAATITIFIFADQFFHTDDFQQKRDRIYEITSVVNAGNKIRTLSETPYLLAPGMKEEIPAIEEIVRFKLRSGAFRYQDKVFSERFYFTDKNFFKVFNFPFIEGGAQVLESPQNIVLTKKMVEKYFGDRSPINQTVSVKFGNGHSEEFTVGAVLDPPANNTMGFDFLLSMEAHERIYPKNPHTWADVVHATFLLLKPGHTIDEVAALSNKYKATQNEASPEWKTEEFKFYPLADLTTRSHEIESGIVGSGEPQGVYALLVVVFMLLLLATFNYMNISIATVTTRLKEIGIRKVLGGQRTEIMQQFLTENFLLCLIAVVIGFLIANLFFMPWLNTLLAFKIPFSFSSTTNMILFFVGLIAFIMLLSGLYPAVYISRFQPVVILKGKEKFGQRSKLSRILLTLQFVSAFTTIVGCFVYIDNNLYLKNKDWGYDHHQNIVVPLASSDQYIKLRDKIANQTDVISLAGAVNHVGEYRSTVPIEHEGQKFEMVPFKVGFDYLETMNLRLSSGRLFEKTIQSDQVEFVVVNENFVRAMGWENPINQTFEYDSIKRNVIGVVKNFHYTDFYRSVLPVMFTIAPEKEFNYLTLKVTNGSATASEANLKNLWKEIAPDDPYKGMLQDDVFSNWAHNSENEMKLMSFITAITIMLACLGLFGLVSYNITRRLKEFSIRKVFGANTLQIFKLMNRDYILILAIAFVIGAPFGLWLMDILIHQTYADPQPAGVLPFAISILLMVVTVAITVGSQMNRIVNENPAQTLKAE